MLLSFYEGDSLGCATAYLGMTSVYVNMGKYSMAIDILKKAKNRIKSFGDRMVKAEVLNILGTIKRNQDEYDNALIYHEASEKIFSHANKPVGLAKVHREIGEDYKAEGNTKEASEYFIKAREAFRTKGAKADLKDVEGKIDLLILDYEDDLKCVNHAPNGEDIPCRCEVAKEHIRYLTCVYSIKR